MLTPSQEQVLSRSSHTAIIANAGSGKTRVLVEQYIKFLLEDETLSPRDIVTITFSEQSAQDIKKKIRDALKERIKYEINESVLRRLYQIQDRMQSAVITTIHSFCFQILRYYPVESQTDSSFSTITSPADQLLKEECVQQILFETLSDGYQSGASSATVEFVKKYGRKKVTELLHSLFSKRFSLFKLQQVFAGKDNSQIASWWYSIIETTLSNLIDAHFERSYYDGLLVHLSKTTRPDAELLLAKYDEAHTTNDKIAALPKILTYFHTGSWDKINGNRFSKVKEELNGCLPVGLPIFRDYKLLMQTFVSSDDTYSRLLQDCSEARQILDLFSSALSAYNERKEYYSLIDFDDMLSKADELLQRPEICSELSTRYTYILVDEYQDTDDLQYNIIRSLTSNFSTTNRLIIVGDPKQSIYRFRNANIALFNQTVEEIADSTQQQAIELKESFRMLAHPMAFINKVFSSVFSDKSEVPYNELILARSDDAEGSVEILINNINSLPVLNDDDENDAEELVTGEPEMIAAKIAQLVETNSTKKVSDGDVSRQIIYRDIGILIRSRTHLEKLESALHAFNIPFTTYGGKGFYSSQEIIDITSYLAFLVNPTDDVALYGVLRSPYFSLTDSVLIEITNRQGVTKQSSLWERFRIYIDSHDKPYFVKRAFQQISANLELVGKLTSTSLIEKIYTESMIFGIYNLYTHSKQKIANLQKFSDLSVSFHSTGFQSTYDFLERIMLLSQREEDEALGESLEDTNAVHIMTIHRSKGLEFPVVFLPFLHTKILGGDQGKSKYTLEDGIGICINDPQVKSVSPLAAYFSLLANERTIEESKRIFYVGATRVREHLILSATIKGETIPKNSYLQWVTNAFGSDLSSDLVFQEPIKRYDSNSKTTRSDILSLSVPVVLSIPISSIPEPKSVEELPFQTSVVNTLSIPYEEGITRYSPSQLLVYKECPTKYHLRFNLGIPEDSRLSFNFEAADSAEILRGTVVGQLVHRMFEHVDSMISNGVLDEYVFIGHLHNLLESFGLEINDGIIRYADIVRSHINTFILSEFGKRVLSSPRNYTELALRVKLNQNQILSGVIDRVFFDNQGWHILDYKTDRFINNPTKDERYKFQLLFYSYLLKKLFAIDGDIHAHLFYSKFSVVKDYTFSNEHFVAIETKLSQTVEAILTDKHASSLNILQKHREHCRECGYYFEQTGECLVER